MHVVSPSAPPTQLIALLMPADAGAPCRIVSVRNRAAAISEAIGGGLIDDVLIGGTTGGMYVLYAGDEDSDEQIVRPDNPRAAVQAARLGHHGREVQRRLRGTVLATGLHATGTGDTDSADPAEQTSLEVA